MAKPIGQDGWESPFPAAVTVLSVGLAVPAHMRPAVRPGLSWQMDDGRWTITDSRGGLARETPRAPAPTPLARARAPHPCPRVSLRVSIVPSVGYTLGFFRGQPTEARRHG